VLRHWTFTADNVQNVAAVMAEILGGEVVIPPRPPWSEDSLWVCLFDEFGTMLEVAPTGSVWVPHDVLPAAEERMENPPQYSYNHTFWDSAVSFERIREICAEQGWRTVFLDGNIKFQGVWVENHTFVEFCPKDYLGLYTKIYGTAGRAGIHDYVKLKETQVKEAQARALAASSKVGAEPAPQPAR
jgi:hypothetical protein